MKKKYFATGSLVGFVNGLLGGGAGGILVPILQRWLSPREALATSLAVLFPLSCGSVLMYYVQGNLDLALALPYVLGGAVGGIVGGRLFPQLKVQWLQRAFALLLLFSGGRCLLW